MLRCFHWVIHGVERLRHIRGGYCEVWIWATITVRCISEGHSEKELWHLLKCEFFNKEWIHKYTYTEKSAPLLRRYCSAANEFFPVWLLIAKWIGLHPVELGKFTSCLNFSISSFTHASRPCKDARCNAAKPCRNRGMIRTMVINKCMWKSVKDTNVG